MSADESREREALDSLQLDELVASEDFSAGDIGVVCGFPLLMDSAVRLCHGRELEDP